MPQRKPPAPKRTMVASLPQPLIDPPKDWSPAWLTAPVSLTVIEALGADTVCFVGGAVRDSLLGRDAADVDMATSLRPDEVQTRLTTAGIKTVPTGLQHGTVTAVMDGETREITTLRVDVETDGRHARVAFTDNWRADAERRDFTINTLYTTPDGRLYDPFGGLADLRAGRVRFVGEAEQRIQEDALRIYRFFRFSARFGSGLDPEGLEACRVRSSDVEGLSQERIRDELLKLLAVDDPRPFIDAMGDIGVLPKISTSDATDDGSAGASSPGTLARDIGLELTYSKRCRPIVRLCSLYPGSSCTALGHFFRLSKRQVDFMQACQDAGRAMEQGCKPEAVLYRYGKDVVQECLKRFDSPARDSFLEAVALWQHQTFPVNGQDLINQGYEPGPVLGAVLVDLEQRWIDSGFRLGQAELLASCTSQDSKN